MKRILMVKLPFAGHTNPTLDLAWVFVELGHEVTYIHSPVWRDKIEATGRPLCPTMIMRRQSFQILKVGPGLMRRQSEDSPADFGSIERVKIPIKTCHDSVLLI